MKYLQSQWFLRWALPAFLSLLIGGLLFFTLQWAAEKADIIAAGRQKDLVLLTVGKLKASVAHDQESATVWDDAVRNSVQRDVPWLDANLGVWMHTYFHHDAAIVLGKDLKPLYQFVAGEDHPPRTDELATAYLPLARRLQQRLALSDAAGTSDSVLSIGEADLIYVGFRPAIVSVKPIVSDTGEIEQRPGEENLHVAVRFLDGDLPASIGNDYQFASVTFSLQQPTQKGYSFVPLHARDGAVIGYFHWEPFRPGLSVVKSTSPALGLALIVVFSALSLAGGAIYRRTARLASSQAALRHQACHDSLTGLANRAFFNEELEARIQSAPASEKHWVLFVDLDRFKQVNDTFGHPVGDKLIAMVASRLEHLLPFAMIARIGGDEFTIHLQGKQPDEAAQISDDIIGSLKTPFEIDGVHVSIGASIGVACSSGAVEHIELTRQADIALYHAKAAGRNRYAIFGDHMDQLLRDRRALERDLRVALDANDQIEVYYQPVYTANGAGPCSLEALVRWRHPLRGHISPDEFIPVAEETGLIQEIGAFVLQDACSVLAELPSITVSINASVRELELASYPLRVLTALAKCQLKPDRLEIELTESLSIGDNAQLDRSIMMLRRAGVKIAIDDFGTGFSTFSRVQKFDVDRLKIDKSFVDDMHRPDSQALVAAIIKMAQAKGLLITAEGVETAEQQEQLRSLGCDNLQGFHLSKPLPRHVVMTLFKPASQAG